MLLRRIRRERKGGRGVGVAQVMRGVVSSGGIGVS